jgi:hypothetical protein
MSKADRRELLVVSGIAAILLVPIALLLCAELKAPPMVAAAKVAAAKVAQVKPTKRKPKGKNKMVKIAFGQTKQADLVSAGFGDVLYDWQLQKGGATVATMAAPDDWIVTPTGVVTVPVDVSAIGACALNVNLDKSSDPGFLTTATYEFEVVCIDGEIRIAPVIS